MEKDNRGCGCGGGGAEPQDGGEPARPSADEIAKFRKHFVDPPNEFKRLKAEVFQIERSVIDKRLPIYLCSRQGRHTRFHPEKKLDPSIYEARDYLHRVTPKDLEHLKALAGVPNEVHLAERERGDGCYGGVRPWPVEMVHIPAEGTIHYSRLTAQQRAAVQNLSLNLLMGQVDARRVAGAPFKAVVDAMLSRASNLPTFVGKDLFVCPADTVEFIGFGAVHFDNVVVLGGGQIILGPGTKLHAYQVKHA